MDFELFWKQLKEEATDADWGMLLLFGFFLAFPRLVMADRHFFEWFVIPTIIYLILQVIMFYKRYKEKKKPLYIMYGFGIAFISIMLLLDYALYNSLESAEDIIGTYVP